MQGRIIVAVQVVSTSLGFDGVSRGRQWAINVELKPVREYMI